MNYAIIAEHRRVNSVRRMCRCFNIHPSRFYVRTKNPLSYRACEDARQTNLLNEAWNESGKFTNILSGMMIWWSWARPTAQIVLLVWSAWQAFALRSATSVGQERTAASHLS